MPRRAATHEPKATGEAGGPRSFWSGVLSFGLVSIPVDLHPANREGGAPLRTLDADGTPLARRYYCPEDGEDVPPEHLVRGYELDDGRYVVVTDEELEAVDPKKSREIDLRLFTDQGTLDPLYFDRGYFLAPARESGKAYRLLAAVMERTKRAGIATFVMREREYLVAIFSEGGVLRAETLRFAPEVRSAREVGLPKPEPPAKALVKKLEAAIESLEMDRLPTAELTDDHADALKHLVEQKLRRKKDVVHAARTEATPELASAPSAHVIDLMDALRRSVKGGGGTRRHEAHGRPAPANRHAAGPRSRAKRRGARS